jgi:hypothetical protein
VPPQGWRRRAIGFVYNSLSAIFCFFAGIHPTFEKRRIDYSKYLGENYMKENENQPIKNPSAFVVNHCGWLDTHVLYCYY